MDSGKTPNIVLLLTMIILHGCSTAPAEPPENTPEPGVQASSKEDALIQAYKSNDCPGSAVVVVEFTVEADGSVSDPIVVAEEIPGKHHNDALRAIKKWKFPPKTANGVPATRRARIPITFNPCDNQAPSPDAS